MINYTIAITGGIGSGKSTVSSLIKNLGFQVYSADEIYNDLIKQPKIVNDICNLLYCLVNYRYDFINMLS